MQQPLIIPAIGSFLGLLCLWGAFASGRKRWLVEGLPTSKTTGVFIGLVEVKGTAETSQPLKSFLAERTCVYYAWSVEEHWSRIVTETYTDSDGKTKTRIRHESGWTTVAGGGDLALFYLQDDCGQVLVRPQGATLESVEWYAQNSTPGDSLYYVKGPAGAVPDSDHRRRFTERGIPLHAPLYVMGKARERADVVAAEIAADKEAPMFLISTRTEDQVRSGFQGGLWGWNLFGIFLCGTSVAIYSAATDRTVNWALVIGAVLLFFVPVGLAWVWMVYNCLVDLRNRVRQGWSQVDVQLKRRYDLIQNLVGVVQGLRNHEADLQTELAALRAQMGATPPGQPGPDPQSLRATVHIMAERYPELKADAGFAALEKNLIETEQRIALARAYFNDIATHFNTRLEVVPECYVAGLAGLKPQPLLTAEDFERAPVSVNL